jgi:hypothetical protein
MKPRDGDELVDVASLAHSTSHSLGMGNVRNTVWAGRGELAADASSAVNALEPAACPVVSVDAITETMSWCRVVIEGVPTVDGCW